MLVLKYLTIVFPKVVFNNVSSLERLNTEINCLNVFINGALISAIIKKNITNNLIVLK